MAGRRRRAARRGRPVRRAARRAMHSSIARKSVSIDSCHLPHTPTLLHFSRDVCFSTPTFALHSDTRLMTTSAHKCIHTYSTNSFHVVRVAKDTSLPVLLAKERIP